ncbi:hypothetical protein BYT27DRAFT_7197587 [Phlegmacium glaucopus]|nr:hypothetical protein BYT27DRAFT_7197587 [Phlegmacium glaucopus]
MSRSQEQPLPSFKLVSSSGHHKAILPNLSYPSRPHSHISWSRSLVPLRFANNLDVRSRPTLAFSYASATATPTTGDESEDEDDTDFRGIRGLIRHLFTFTGKVKLLVQKLIRTRSATSSTVVNSYC